jgi:SAM-dependent methyltransferase
VKKATPTPRSVHQVFYDVENRHWWFVARRRVILTLLKKVLERGTPRQDYSVCDLGTGCGATLAELSRRYRAVGMDISAEAVELGRCRGNTVFLGALPDLLPFRADSFDAVLALDVIEHVDDDRAAVTGIRRILKPGGVLLTTVPAYPWLWTKRDDYHQHKRRYVVNGYLRLLRSAGFGVERLSYFNSALFPLAVVERLTKRMLGRDRAEPDVAIPPEPFNALMRGVFQSEAFLLPHCRLPCGLSIIAVARRSSC